MSFRDCDLAVSTPENELRNRLISQVANCLSELREQRRNSRLAFENWKNQWDQQFQIAAGELGSSVEIVADEDDEPVTLRLSVVDHSATSRAVCSGR